MLRGTVEGAAMADKDEGAVDTATLPTEGVYLVGAYLGVKRPAPYDIDGKSGISRPKFGLLIDGAEVAVVCEDDRELYALTAGQGHAKGDILTVRVYPITGRFGLRWQTTPRAGGQWE